MADKCGLTAYANVCVCVWCFWMLAAVTMWTVDTRPLGDAPLRVVISVPWALTSSGSVQSSNKDHSLRVYHHHTATHRLIILLLHFTVPQLKLRLGRFDLFFPSNTVQTCYKNTVCSLFKEAVSDLLWYHLYLFYTLKTQHKPPPPSPPPPHSHICRRDTA